MCIRTFGVLALPLLETEMKVLRNVKFKCLIFMLLYFQFIYIDV